MIVIVVANLLRRAFATGTVCSAHLFAKVKGWPRVFRVEKATTVERIKKKERKKNDATMGKRHRRRRRIECWNVDYHLSAGSLSPSFVVKWVRAVSGWHTGVSVREERAANNR